MENQYCCTQKVNYSEKKIQRSQLEKIQSYPLGYKIKFLRLERNLFLKNLAEALNVSVTSVWYWENGVKKPHFSKIILLCKFFDVPLTFFDNSL